MPNIDMVGTSYGPTSVTDRRWTPADVPSPPTTAEFAATQDIRTMDAWLTANYASYWTADRLRQESFWDKIFFMRQMQSGGAGLA